MKKHFVKQMMQSATALALCAAVLTVTPFPKTPVPGANSGKPGIIVEIPEGEDGIAPMRPASQSGYLRLNPGFLFPFPSPTFPDKWNCSIFDLQDYSAGCI